jgi:hypothetical protein
VKSEPTSKAGFELCSFYILTLSGLLSEKEASIMEKEIEKLKNLPARSSD